MKVSTVMLMIATFFNPLGFDALFALVMKLTGSYWITDIVFYSVSLLFFGLYYYFSQKENRRPSKDSGS
jgi:hypothetical protein